MFKKFKSKVLPIYTILSLLLNSLSPLVYFTPQIANAQEAQVSEAPAEEPTPADEVTPLPSSENPTVEPSPSEPTIEPSSNPDNNSNPSQNNNPSSDNSSTTPDPTSVTSAVTPSVSPSENPDDVEKGEVHVAILENVAAPSVDLGSVTSDTSAVLSTDKLDYAPTDTAIITAAGLLPNTQYTLYVSSTDPPPVNYSKTVTTNDDGAFVDAYQLDGTYRPNYKIEVKDGEGNIVASTTFTDSPNTCSKDAQGANDQPGQKDLTQMCADYNPGPANTIKISWNWDEINGSGGNTFDACSLYDTDNDGFANYSACVTVTGSPLAQAANSPRIYSCNDANSDKCASSVLVAGPYATSCSTAQTSPDPFPTGDAYPNDTTATCNINLPEVGGSTSKLLDVCSYPSQQPNSSPSDCIIASTANQTGLLEVKKVLSPTDDPGKFNLQMNSNTITSDAGNGGTTGEKIVTAGNNTFGETQGTGTLLSNYTPSVVCKDGNGNGNTVTTTPTGTNTWSLSVANGADVVCTITNTRVNNGSITIVKDADPNDAQDFVFTTGAGLSNFILDDDSDLVRSNTQTFPNLGAGTYTVTEGATTGWTLSNLVCTDPTNNSTVNASTATIVLAAGESVTCTYTNTKKGHLIVQKTTLPAGDLTSFSITASGSGTITGGGAGTVTDATDKDYEVTLGTYSVTETQVAGWAVPQYSNCSNVVVAAGQTATCIITNTKISTLKVVKTVVNNNGGGLTASSFNVHVKNGVTDVTGSPAAGSTSGTTYTLATGTYTVSEDSPTSLGYAQTSITCDNSKVNPVVLNPGDNVTCTITNDDNAPQLHLRKTVTNDNGGNSLETAWTLTATGTGGSPTNLSGSTPVDSGAAFKADTYALAESGPSGYTAGAWNCGGATMPDATHVTVPFGGNITCTINNNDTAAHLIVIKHVINDNGGTAAALAFNTTVSGVTTASPTAAGAESPGVDNVLTTVGSYSVDEGAHVGYTKILSAECSGTIALGQTKTCTITNDDIAPKLHLRKVVTNDNGGSATVANFTLTANGTGSNDISGTSPVDSGTGLLADTFALSETNPGGYTAGSWACVGGTQNGSNITLGLDQEATCTITNDDNAAHLVIIKQVVNDNGGTKTEGNFSGTISGVTVTGGNVWTGTADPGVNKTLTTIGNYTISENADSDYTTTYSTDCSGSIALGQTKTCTVTNNDKAAHLIVIKHVINDNGGSATASTFTTTITGVTTATPSGAGAESPGVNNTLTSVGSYAVDEGAHVGYAKALSAECSGIISLGQTKTCTITNNDIAPQLKVIKSVINDNGGSAVAGAFTMLIAATNPSQLFFGGNELGTTITLNVGGYSVGETGVTGYSGSFSTDCSGSIAIGQTKTCTVTNDDIQPKLTVTKVVGSGTAQVSDFPLFVNATSVTSGVQNGFNAGAYTVSETNKTGYTGVISGDCSANGSITLSVGDVKACTITNTRDTGTITVDKVTDPSEDSTEFEIKLTAEDLVLHTSTLADQDTPDTYQINTSSSYTLAETAVTGWDLASASCTSDKAGHTGIVPSDFSVAKDEHITCIFTNEKRGRVVFIKYFDKNKDGKQDEGEDPLSGWEMNLGDESKDTNASGEATFENVTPGIHSVSETLQDGWDQTGFSCDSTAREGLDQAQSNGQIIIVNPGKTVTCKVGNFTDPILTIEKSNNKTGIDQSPGAQVLYTLTVTATQSAVKDVTVTDLLPKGFVYQGGSWTASSSIHGILNLPEPTYHSPGTWQLGDMDVDEKITLTLLATIDGSQKSGLYKDVAFAQGTSLASTDVLANSDTGVFVGTDVNVVSGEVLGAEHKVNQTQEVLGASTIGLPATGGKIFWIYIAGMILIFGFGSVIIGYYLRRKYNA